MNTKIGVLLLLILPFLDNAGSINPLLNSAFKGYAWTEQKQFSVESESGSKTAFIQSLTIKRPEAGGVLKNYALVSLDGVKGGLFSRQCDFYILQNGQLIGVAIESRELVLRFQNIDTTGDWATSLLNQINLNENYIYELNGRNSTVRFALERIFGDVAYVQGPAALIGAQGDFFAINGVTFSDKLMRISIETTSKRSLELSLDSTTQIDSASESGQNIRLLGSGIVGDCRSWIGPTKKPYTGKTGTNTVILGRERAYEFVDTEGEDSTSFLFAAWGEDGKVWIGPSTCNLVEFGGMILGIETDNDKCNLLRIYSSDLKIETGRNGIAKFEEKLRDLDDSLATSGIVGIPNSTIDLAKLFPDRDNLVKVDLRVRTIRYDGLKLKVVLRTRDPNTFLVVVLGPTISDASGYVSEIAKEEREGVSPTH